MHRLARPSSHLALAAVTGMQRGGAAKHQRQQHPSQVVPLYLILTQLQSAIFRAALSSAGNPHARRK